jgi:hypothetical protein
VLFTAIFIISIASVMSAFVGLREAHLGVSRLMDEISRERSSSQNSAETFRNAA